MEPSKLVIAVSAFPIYLRTADDFGSGTDLGNALNTAVRRRYIIDGVVGTWEELVCNPRWAPLRASKP